jgi:recombination protein RecR
MNITKYPSVLLERAVTEFSKLPGIGQKTAFRLIMHMLRNGKEQLYNFSDAIKQLADNIKYCKICNSISDEEVCSICSNQQRDKLTICVVEDVNDLMAIERTGQYNGVYHVLNGLISPVEGISPSQLNIESLENRLKTNEIKEVIFALSSTVEGDTTAFYLYKRLYAINSIVKYTTLAKGIAFGNELEYTDEITLAKSIKNRQSFV